MRLREAFYGRPHPTPMALLSFLEKGTTCHQSGPVILSLSGPNAEGQRAEVRARVELRALGRMQFHLCRGTALPRPPTALHSTLLRCSASTAGGYLPGNTITPQGRALLRAPGLQPHPLLPDWPGAQPVKPPGDPHVLFLNNTDLQFLFMWLGY